MSARGPEIWFVDPYVGVGPLRLGWSRREVEDALGATSLPVDKGDPEPVAVFGEHGVHAHFDGHDRCEAIELMPPARPALDDLAILARSYADVAAWLAERDPGLVVRPPDVVSDALGIGLYAPEAETDPDRPAEGMIVFVRGYYDD